MSTPARIIWGCLALFAFCSFIALGNWQVERRAWKHDLIERVNTRIHAPAVPAPPRQAWSSVTSSPQDHEYLRVQLSGQFLRDSTSLVQATTALGSGYWVMSPLRTTDGAIYFVNRGFVPRAQAEGPWIAPPAQPLTLTGLLRLSEPGGAFLRDNAPDQDVWYSRDVAQLALRHGLSSNVAPFFVDAEATALLPPELTLEPPRTLPEDMLPVAGLTVVTFSDNHLSYLLTWYALALMVALASAYVIREEYRLRRR